MLSPISDLGKVLGYRVLVKRDELIDTVIQGNKWRKLTHNMAQIQAKNCPFVITYGGAYSNHLVALAAYANKMGVQSVGVVRGEELVDSDKWSHTLKQCQQYGMIFHFVSRQSYRQKGDHAEIANIIDQYPGAIQIPEGGSNALAVKGMSEVINECVTQIDMIDDVDTIDYLFAACGTGGSLAGLIEGVYQHNLKTKVIGIPVLKGAQFLYHDIEKLSPHCHLVDWHLDFRFHFGGYAKCHQTLSQFIDEFYRQYHIKTEEIYTGKLFYAVWQFILNQPMNDDESAKTIMIYHSGGLQGKKTPFSDNGSE